MSEITQLLNAIGQGDRQATVQLLPLVYQELRRLACAHMAQERGEHTLQATALVHEAYLQLVGEESQDWDSRGHFFAAAATAMRRILIDSARRKKTKKRGAGMRRQPLDMITEPERNDQLLAFDEALKKFAEVDPTKAKLVEQMSKSLRERTTSARSPLQRSSKRFVYFSTSTKSEVIRIAWELAKFAQGGIAGANARLTRLQESANKVLGKQQMEFHVRYV